MSYLNGSNDWGEGTDETLGDVLEEKLEDEAKDAAKDGAKKGGKAAAKGLDKLTDKVSPIKAIKDKLKDKITNNPIARLKRSVQKLKKKVADGAKKLAKEGAKAVGRAIAHALKGIISWIIANPIPSLIIFIVLFLIFSYADIEMEDSKSDSDNKSSYSSETTGGVSDDDAVVIMMDDCASQASGGSISEGGETSTNKTESAKQIYSIFRSYGFTNASIAGILGNLDCESGLDPTCIEGIYDEPAFLGPRKSAAIKSMSDYTVNDLFPKYARKGLKINRNAYKGNDKKYYCGMGIVQWTGPGAYNFLSAAKTVNMDWYTMEYQLAYMLSDTLYRKNFFTQWIAAQETGNDVETAKKAAIKFAHEYEGNHSFDNDRREAGKNWFNIIKDWGDGETDTAFVDSITAMATQLGGLIEFDELAKTQERCGNSAGTYDNSSLANAAVSYAWPTKEQSYNDGTNLYKTVIHGVFNDSYYKACDRAVAGAVRWSGTDDDYPLVTSTQLSYLASSPKWELVGMSDSLKEEDLQPGDVFILDGHTLMYVGTEAITQIHGDKAEPGSNSVSASLDERAASCNTDVTHFMVHGDSRGPYHVYRCAKPDNSSTYSSIGTGVK